jgi:CSLREA domain-containing protein
MMKWKRLIGVTTLMLVLALMVAPPAYAASYLVNTTSDSDDGVCDTAHCSLREALRLSQPETGEMDIITFNIPGAGPHTIRPATRLPHVTSDVIIDGFAEPDYRRFPIVELDGSALTGDAWGLMISGDHSTVRGLLINRFYNGIRIDGDQNHIEGNFIGVSGVGLAALPNRDSGIVVHGSSNIIGGVSHVTGGSPCNSPCNLISGNIRYGVALAGANNSSVYGNLIGTDRDGVSAIANGDGGVYTSSSFGEIGSSGGGGNVISGNGGIGVTVHEHVYGRPTENSVAGNRIGINARGTTALPNDGDGVQIARAIGTMVWGNQIAGNMGSGVVVVGSEAQANWIRSNLIGTGPDGSTVIPTTGHGIALYGASSTFIGGTSPGDGNTIRGHTGFAILLGANFLDPIQVATDTEIEGNTITENNVGIVLQYAHNTRIGGTSAGARNVISGNSGMGVSINGEETSGTVIQGNYVGTTPDGVTAQPNNNFGIGINDQTDVLIGGTAPGAGNLISGNSGNGIRLSDSTGIIVQGNRIGTNAAGTAAVPNASGLAIFGGSGNIVGGTTAAAHNVISGNSGQGIDIRDSSANLIRGNFIGTDAAGTAPLGNFYGIQIQDSSDNRIGGSEAGAANVIANNGSYGITIWESAGTTLPARGNIVSQNAISGNGAAVGAGLGIELGNDWITPNDRDDPDGGPNRRQNFPVLSSAVSNGTNTSVDGTLNSRPDTRYRIEFFANRECDASGYGEGERYLGFVEVRTGGSGNVTINAPGLAPTAAGEFVTATATDLSRNETSEFSTCADVTMSVTAPIIAEIEALTASIVKLGDAGVIRPAPEKTLIKLSTGAIKQLEKGNTGAAVGRLNAAVNKINAWVKSGKLDGQTGQMLIDQTNAIIQMIEKTNADPVDPPGN